MKAKKLMAVLLAAATALSLAACAGSGSSEGSSAAGSSAGETGSGTASESENPASSESGAAEATGDQKTLRIMWWGPENRHEATLKAIDLYESQNPDIKFTPEYLGWDGYWSKLVVLASSNTLPDIMQMDAQYISDYTSNNQLADLGDVDLDGIVPDGIQENIKVDGVRYGIPLGQNGGGLAYNKTVLEEHSVTLPWSGWTWDDYYAFVDEAAEKLPDGLYGASDMTNSWEMYQYHQASLGKGNMMDGSTLTIDKDTWMAWMERMAAGRESGSLPTPEETLSFVENDAAMDPLASGKIMTKSVTVGSVGAMIGLMPDAEIGVVNWPVGDGGAGWAQSTIFLSVAESTSYKQEAKDFCRWFISDVDAGKILMTVRGIPVSEEVYKAIEADLTPSDQLGKALMEVVSANNPRPFFASPTPFIDFTASPAGTYKSTMEEYMFGSITLDQAYEKIIALGDEIAKNNA